MSRITPSRAMAARVESRPPFTTSTQVQNVAGNVTGWQRNGASPTASRRTGSPALRQPRAVTEHYPANVSRPLRGGAFTTPGAQYHPTAAATPQYPANTSPPMDGTFNGLLNDLVSISHNIERYMAENQTTLSTRQAESLQRERALKAEEIERVVRRVETHFKSKIEQLEGVVHSQKDVIVELSKERDMWKQKCAENQNGNMLQSSVIGDAVRNSLVSRAAALDEWEKNWQQGKPSGGSSTINAGAAATDVTKDGSVEMQQLRQILLEEKRQRLLVEEQTQSLTEQHAKVVHTLEQRIRKQEKQLQVIMDAFEQQQQQQHQSSGAGLPAFQHPTFGDVATSGGDTAASSGSAGGGQVRTPRSVKFRQRQLRISDDTPAHNGATATQQSTPDPYSQRMSPVAAPTASSVSVSTRVSGGSTSLNPPRSDSVDIAEVIQMSSKTSPRGPSAMATAPSAAFISSAANDNSGVDDVALFLANISKELESIHDMEIQRQTKIASLS